MTIVMRGSPAGGDSSQENQQNAQTVQAVPPTAVPTTSQQQLPAPTLPGEENGQGDVTLEPGEEIEPEFPVQELSRLDEMINRPRWVVPVLPKGELELLLDACIKLCKDGKHTFSRDCYIGFPLKTI